MTNPTAVIRVQELTVYVDGATAVDPATITLDYLQGGVQGDRLTPLVLLDTPELRAAVRALVRVWDEADEEEASARRLGLTDADVDGYQRI